MEAKSPAEAVKKLKTLNNHQIHDAHCNNYGSDGYDFDNINVKSDVEEV